MRAARVWSRLGLLAMALASACQRDALVVVAVSAATQISGIAALHVSGTVGSTTREHDVAPVPGGQLPLAGPAPFTFGMYVTCGLGGAVMLKVEARDNGGQLLGSGLGTAPVRCGARSDAAVTLQPGNVISSGGPCVFDTGTFENCTFGP
jgi:hypothetical protein